jgi:UDP-N-acetylglucosamine transferase subunit ALG13
MGTIITALEIGKPLVILPRRAHFNETRNDHQFATAQQFSRQRGIIVALNEEELIQKLDQADIAPVTSQIGSEASPGLISALRSFIEEAGTVKRR